MTVDDGVHMVGQAVEQRSGQCRFRLLARNRYARVVAEVSAGEAVLNEELVRLGHTWMYRRYVSSHRRRRYSALEDEARRTTGLWGANTAPVRPWEWRKGQRSKLLAWLWMCLRNGTSSAGRIDHSTKAMKPGRRNAMRTVFAAAAITIGAALGEARADGPFNVLEWRDGVTTSRSGYAVWVGVGSMEHEAMLPGHESAVTSTNTPSHRAALGVRCRAPGGAIPDRFPPSPPTGGVTLDDHPDQPGAYTVVHPMYWILELAGKHREHWPLRVQIGDGEAIESTFERRLTDYSAPRPGLAIAIPGDMRIDAFTEREIIEVEAVGERMRFRGRFEVTDNARRAAALMRSACAKP